MPSLPSSSSVALAVVVGALVIVAGTTTAQGQAKAPRYTAETPDLTIDAHKARAIAGPTDSDRLAALSVIAQVGDRAAYGASLKAIRDAIAGMPADSEVRGEAAALARSLEPDEGAATGAAKAQSEAGILTDVAV